jgi:predicted transglutaminase-like cysteine proteinase
MSTRLVTSLRCLFLVVLTVFISSWASPYQFQISKEEYETYLSRSVYASLLYAFDEYEDEHSAVVALNFSVNRMVSYEGDWSVWRKSEHWATLTEMNMFRGDCEDSAFLKYVAIKARFPSSVRLGFGIKTKEQEEGSRFHVVALWYPSQNKDPYVLDLFKRKPPKKLSEDEGFVLVASFDESSFVVEEDASYWVKKEALLYVEENKVSLFRRVSEEVARSKQKQHL